MDEKPPPTAGKGAETCSALASKSIKVQRIMRALRNDLTAVRDAT